MAAKLRILLIAVVLGAASRVAEFPARPYQPITYAHERRKDPELALFVVTVDLGDKSVLLRACRSGEDPDGEGPWQTTLQTVSGVAQREKLDVAVNGDFFITKKKPEEPLSYVVGKWASIVHMGMTDGLLWSKHPAQAAMCVDGQGTVRMSALKVSPPDAKQIVSGGPMLVQDGKSVAPTDPTKHPRTVVGMDADGKRLVIMVVDGRRPGWSMGMTCAELAAEMMRQGCNTAMNLDGGGSTTLVMRNPATKKLEVMNRPSGGRERPVASVLGVTIKPSAAAKGR